jgi:DNA-binding transcriptional MerR regulator
MSERQYRMKDLCDMSGLGRQAIHFYIREGLLPEGHKTGRNMAYYTQAHVDRLRMIRRLQDEQFLPLKAIRAVLSAYEDDEEVGGEALAGEGAFSPAQQRLIAAVQKRLRTTLGDGHPEQTTPVAPLLQRLGIEPQDFIELVELGLIAIADGKSGKGKRGRSPAARLADAHMRQDDVWLIEILASLRTLGLSRELGFLPSDLTIIDDAVSALFRKETKLLRKRLAHVDADTAAMLVEHALPIMNQLLVRLHEAKIRNFIAAL